MRSGSAAGLEALEESGANVAREDLAALTVVELGDHLRRLRRVIDRLEAESVRRLARFEQLDGPATLGAPNAYAFLQFHCGLDSGSAAERVLLARTRDALPAVTEAAVSGQISFDQAAIIARGASEVSAEDASTVERRALEMAAAGADPRRLRHMTKAVVAEVDGEALRRDATRAHDRRYLRIGQDRDGSVRVEGLLESECAAYLRTVTDALMGPRDKADERTAPQRRHDALQGALKGVLGGGARLPTVGGQRPHITVVAPLSAMLGEGGPPALLQGLVPISAEQLQRLAAEGSLSATIVDANGREVYPGKARTFSAPKRRSMGARTGTCGWDGGCDRPAEWCDGHHVESYAEGGLTSAATGELLCDFHHRLIEEGGWAIIERAGARQAVPPGHPLNPRTPLLLFAEASRETRQRAAAAISEPLAWDTG
ncbi:MAG TPA: DUF222 domain-containing protein [Candidatus Dormibacteraeota bacterium]|nr:DUF222 domain-containing protein [Candidatus Dormibacteraeota bacterium]